MTEGSFKMLVGEVYIGEKSLEELQIFREPPVSKSTVQRMLLQSSFLVHIKLARAPRIPVQNKYLHFDWCSEKKG